MTIVEKRPVKTERDELTKETMDLGRESAWHRPRLERLSVGLNTSLGTGSNTEGNGRVTI